MAISGEYVFGSENRPPCSTPFSNKGGVFARNYTDETGTFLKVLPMYNVFSTVSSGSGKLFFFRAQRGKEIAVTRLKKVVHP